MAARDVTLKLLPLAVVSHNTACHNVYDTYHSPPFACRDGMDTFPRN